AGGWDAAGQRDVELVFGQTAGEGAFVRGGEGFFVPFSQRVFDAIRFLAVRLAIGRRHLTDAAQSEDDLALLAEVFLVPGAKGRLVGSSPQFVDCPTSEGNQVGRRRGGHERACQRDASRAGRPRPYIAV